MQKIQYKLIVAITLFFLFSMFTLSAKVWVYDYPDTIVSHQVYGEQVRSGFYTVELYQNGEVFNSYVMQDKNTAMITYNPHPNNKPDYMPANTDYNHWTNFSVLGEITIAIERTDGKAIEYCNIYPTKKGYKATIINNRATFTIPSDASPLQLFIEMNDAEENPLFLFCDPPEFNTPDKNSDDVLLIKPGMSADAVKQAILNTDKKIIYFDKGIHVYKQYEKYMCNDDGTRCQDCLLTKGYFMPIVSDKIYYIPGGAFVQASFSGDNISHTTFKGRGIISGAGLSSIRSRKGIPYSLISFNGNGDHQFVDGLVFTCPPHFHIVSRGKITVNNVKLFGWWVSSDGVVGGDYSRFTNNFYKLNDDLIKLYSNYNYLNNSTRYQQVNGAPFQFSWSSQNGNYNVINNTYIVYSNDFIDNSNDIGNTAVINMMKLNTEKTYTGNYFNGLYIDNGCHRLIGIDAKGFGSFNGWTFKNVEMNAPEGKKPQFYSSYLKGGNFSDMRFINFTINGEPVTHTTEIGDKNGGFWIEGEVEGLTFE